MISALIGNAKPIFLYSALNCAEHEKKPNVRVGSGADEIPTRRSRLLLRVKQTFPAEKQTRKF